VSPGVYSDPRLERLRAALVNLAKPASEQIAYLKALGTYPSADELGLEFDDVAGAVLGDEQILSEEQRESVRAVDELLETMSGPQHAELWTGEGLLGSDEWQRVRDAAAVALAGLPEPFQSGSQNRG
jgi:hypothetical protein